MYILRLPFKISKYDQEVYELFFKPNKQIWLYLTDEKINIDINLTKSTARAFFDYENSIKNSPATAKYYRNNQLLYKKHTKEYWEIKRKYDDELLNNSDTSILLIYKSKLDSLQIEKDKELEKFVVKSNYSEISLAAFVILTYDKNNPSDYLYLIDTLENKFTKSVYVKQKANNFRIKISMLEQAVKKGKALSFSLPSIDNKLIKLSDYKGNWVLLDFWASWCAPCVKQMPKIINIQQKYKETNLKVISISIDKDKEKWKQAIEKNKMQNLINLLDKEKDVSRLYQLSFVPYSVLISPEGVIVNAGIYNDKFKQILETIFEKTN